MAKRARTEPEVQARPRGKTALHLAREIAHEIYAAGMAPGDRYRSEAEALERYGVSRGALREALRYLQIQGVIDIRSGPGGGAFVGKPNWEQLAGTLALLLQFAGASTESLMQARTVLDPGIAELAAQARDEADLDPMARALADIDAAIGDYPAFYRAYTRFWNAVARASHNPLLEMLSPALRRLTRSAGIVPDETGQLRALGFARRVNDAVIARDPATARTAMAEMEHTYITDMKARYPRQISRTVAFADFDDDLDR